MEQTNDMIIVYNKKKKSFNFHLFFLCVDKETVIVLQ